MVGVDPVDHGLMVNAEHAADAAEVHAFEVQPDRLTPRLLRVAERLGLWRVNAPTLLAPVTLATRAGMTGFSLLLG